MEINSTQTISPIPPWLRYLKELLDMIKFEHTIFALPFAFIGALAATKGSMPWVKYFWVIIAMVGARTLAMTFNRVADIDVDSENPRTSNRALPAGRIKARSAWLMVGGSAMLFGFAAAKLGPLTTKLAPFAFIVLLGYSLTKRFTTWSHLILGLALSLAPIGAWIAIAGRFDIRVMWLSLGVLAWTAGFDIIYALQDREFDIKKGLYSIPAKLGVQNALKISRLCHFMAVWAWAVFFLLMRVSLLTWLSLVVVALILLREQWIVKDGELSRMDHAFFTLNSLVGIILFAGYFAHWIRH